MPCSSPHTAAVLGRWRREFSLAGARYSVRLAPSPVEAVGQPASSPSCSTAPTSHLCSHAAAWAPPGDPREQNRESQLQPAWVGCREGSNAPRTACTSDAPSTPCTSHVQRYLLSSFPRWCYSPRGRGISFPQRHAAALMGTSTLAADVAPVGWVVVCGAGAKVGTGAQGARQLLRKLAFSVMSHLEY